MQSHFSPHAVRGKPHTDAVGTAVSADKSSKSCLASQKSTPKIKQDRDLSLSRDDIASLSEIDKDALPFSDFLGDEPQPFHRPGKREELPGVKTETDSDNDGDLVIDESFVSVNEEGEISPKKSHQNDPLPDRKCTHDDKNNTPSDINQASVKDQATNRRDQADMSHQTTSVSDRAACVSDRAASVRGQVGRSVGSDALAEWLKLCGSGNDSSCSLEEGVPAAYVSYILSGSDVDQSQVSAMADRSASRAKKLAASVIGPELVEKIIFSSDEDTSVFTNVFKRFFDAVVSVVDRMKWKVKGQIGSAIFTSFYKQHFTGYLTSDLGKHLNKNHADLFTSELEQLQSKCGSDASTWRECLQRYILLASTLPRTKKDVPSFERNLYKFKSTYKSNVSMPHTPMVLDAAFSTSTKASQDKPHPLKTSQPPAKTFLPHRTSAFTPTAASTALAEPPSATSGTFVKIDQPGGLGVASVSSPTKPVTVISRGGSSKALARPLKTASCLFKPVTSTSKISKEDQGTVAQEPPAKTAYANSTSFNNTVGETRGGQSSKDDVKCIVKDNHDSSKESDLSGPERAGLSGPERAGLSGLERAGLSGPDRADLSEPGKTSATEPSITSADDSRGKGRSLSPGEIVSSSPSPEPESEPVSVIPLSYRNLDKWRRLSSRDREVSTSSQSRSPTPEVYYRRRGRERSRSHDRYRSRSRDRHRSRGRHYWRSRSPLWRSSRRSLSRERLYSSRGRRSRSHDRRSRSRDRRYRRYSKSRSPRRRQPGSHRSSPPAASRRASRLTSNAEKRKKSSVDSEDELEVLKKRALASMKQVSKAPPPSFSEQQLSAKECDDDLSEADMDLCSTPSSEEGIEMSTSETGNSERQVVGVVGGVECSVVGSSSGASVSSKRPATTSETIHEDISSVEKTSSSASRQGSNTDKQRALTKESETVEGATTKETQAVTSKQGAINTKLKAVPTEQETDIAEQISRQRGIPAKTTDVSSQHATAHEATTAKAITGPASKPTVNQVPVSSKQSEVSGRQEAARSKCGNVSASNKQNTVRTGKVKGQMATSEAISVGRSVSCPTAPVISKSLKPSATSKSSATAKSSKPSSVTAPTRAGKRSPSTSTTIPSSVGVASTLATVAIKLTEQPLKKTSSLPSSRSGSKVNSPVLSPSPGLVASPSGSIDSGGAGPTSDRTRSRSGSFVKVHTV